MLDVGYALACVPIAIAWKWDYVYKTLVGHKFFSGKLVRLKFSTFS